MGRYYHEGKSEVRQSLWHFLRQSKEEIRPFLVRPDTPEIARMRTPKYLGDQHLVVHFFYVNETRYQQWIAHKLGYTCWVPHGNLQGFAKFTLTPGMQRFNHCNLRGACSCGLWSWPELWDLLSEAWLKSRFFGLWMFVAFFSPRDGRIQQVINFW